MCGQRTGDAPALLPPAVTDARSPQVRSVLWRGPIVQRVTPDGVSIMGRPVNGLLNKPITLTVTPEGDKPLVVKGRVTADRGAFLLRAEGLPANTVCRYTVTVGEKTVGPFHFATAVPPGDSAPFRFAVFGDTQNHGVCRSISGMILKKQPRFMLHMGDHCSIGESFEWWTPNFFDPVRPLLAHVNLVPCHGNHDGANGVFLKMFDIPNYWHTFEYGSVRVISIASFRPWTEGTPQYAWLKKELAKKWDGWLILQTHAPIFGVSDGPNFAWIQKVAPMLLEHGVDFIFSGHEHLFMRSRPIALEKGQRGVIQMISGGGGGGLDGVRKDLPHYVKAQPTWHYVIIDATPEKLSFKAYLPGGKVLDEFVVEKDAPQPDLLLSPTKKGEPWRRP